MHRASSTPSHESRRSELHRPRPKASNATDIARQLNVVFNLLCHIEGRWRGSSGVPYTTSQRRQVGFPALGRELLEPKKLSGRRLPPSRLQVA